MTESKPPKRNLSRTAVITAVALLLVIAIAGIVLARRDAPQQGTAAAVPDAAPASTPLGASAPTAAASSPNEVVFAPLSDKLPAHSNDVLSRFSETARGGTGTVRLTARFLTGENKARDLELAKARTTAIRHAIIANGVKADGMQVELIEMPAGSLNGTDGNRVDMTLR
ncbi:MAG: hypothetical protein ABJA61_01810 [Caldimonas sp.]